MELTKHYWWLIGAWTSLTLAWAPLYMNKTKEGEDLSCVLRRQIAEPKTMFAWRTEGHVTWSFTAVQTMHCAQTCILRERNALDLLIYSFEQKITLTPVVPFALRLAPDAGAAHIKSGRLPDRNWFCCSYLGPRRDIANFTACLPHNVTVNQSRNSSVRHSLRKVFRLGSNGHNHPG